MGRGLSSLQKSILGMAHERFVEDMDRYDAGEKRGRLKGILYDVNVGPVLPTLGSLDEYYENKAYKARRALGLTDEEFEQYQERVRSDEPERVRAQRQETEAQLRQAAPELWDRWRTPCWRHAGGGWADDEISYEVLQAGGYLNNAPATREMEARLREKGLDAWRSWLGGGVLYTCEILRNLYGFEPGPDSYREYYLQRGQRKRDYIKFDPAQIGHERYNRARATVSRAVKRLNDRVLVDACYGSVTITLEGVAEVTGLTVKEVCHQHNLNRRGADGNIICAEPPTDEEVAERQKAVEELQNLLNPPPPPLADAFAAAIAQHAAYYQREPTEEEIEDALEQAQAARVMSLR